MVVAEMVLQLAVESALAAVAVLPLPAVSAASSYTECEDLSHVASGVCTNPNGACKAGSGYTNVFKTDTLASQQHAYVS